MVTLHTAARILNMEQYKRRQCNYHSTQFKPTCILSLYEGHLKAKLTKDME